MENYKYILLDWDGNLAKTLDLWLDASRITLGKRGLDLSDEEIAASFGGFTKYWKEWGVQDVDDAIAEACARVRQGSADVELYPGALEVLEGLHAAGKQMALLTSSPHENVDHLLKKHNVSRFLQVVIAGDDVTRHKPDPEALNKAISHLGGQKHQAIMVGDSDKDIGAAKNAGIDSILFYPDEHKKFYNLGKLRELKPSYVVGDLRRVLGIV